MALVFGYQLLETFRAIRPYRFLEFHCFEAYVEYQLVVFDSVWLYMTARMNTLEALERILVILGRRL